MTDVDVKGEQGPDAAGGPAGGGGPSPIVELPLDRLRRGVSPRAGEEDPKHVRALAETYSKLPPIVVHRATMTVIDGNHRVKAAKLLGRRTIAAVFFDGDEDDAYVEAIRCNVAHGRPLTLGERERAASRMIATHPDWSDRLIGEVCGLSPKTVARRRPATEDGRPSPTRVGRDGRRRPTDPASVRTRVAELLARRPDASVRQIAAHTAASEATVRDVRERLRQGESPLTPRQAGQPEPSPPRSCEGRTTETISWVEDPAVRSSTEGPAFAEWFQSVAVSDADWECYVERLPLSRLYLAAGEARSRANSWVRFAEALERRIERTARR